MHQQWNSITQETLIISPAIYFVVWNLPISIYLESLYHRPSRFGEIATHNNGGDDQVWSGATHPTKSLRSVQPTGSHWGIGCHQLWHVGVQDQRCHPKTFLWHGMKLGNRSFGDTLHYTIRGKGKYHLTYTSLNMKQAVHVCEYIYQYPIRRVISIHRV